MPHIPFRKGEGRVFYGTHEFSLDSKGRISVPAKWRKQNESDEFVGFVTPRGLTNSDRVCLRIYIESDFDAFMEKMDSSRYSISQAAETQILDTTVYLKLDAQGRITLPPEIRRAIHLDGVNTAVMFGAKKHFEVWNAEDKAFDHEAAEKRVSVVDVLDGRVGAQPLATEQHDGI